MTQRILYPIANGIAVITPTQEAVDLYGSLQEVALKDVPAGCPFIIVSATSIPVDRTFRNAWEADFSNPDGYGIGADAWFAQQAAQEAA